MFSVKLILSFSQNAFTGVGDFLFPLDLMESGRVTTRLIGLLALITLSNANSEYLSVPK